MRIEFENSCSESSANEHFSSLMDEIMRLISHLKGVDQKRLAEEPLLANHGLDLVDLVDIILEIEKTYGLVIPDEVPVQSTIDLVNYVHPILSFIHSLKAPSDSIYLN